MPLYEKPQESIHESLTLMNVYNQSGPPITHFMAVVTKDMKYVYWGYAGDGFEETEELYYLDNDPMELTNQAGNPEYIAAMQQMRKTYDQQLGNWKSEGVSYNNYSPYGTLFDRHTKWADKEPVIETLKKKTKKK